MDNWIMWLIFGLIIAALVGFLVFTFIKDKRKNRKIIEKRIELRRATVRTSKELAIRIYTMIEMNNEFLKLVIPGSSKIKMKHVNSTARTFLKDIYDSRAFKMIYIESDEADPNFAQYIASLIKTNSNLWEKKSQNEISYFKSFHNELSSDPKFDEIKEETKKEINNIFEKEVNK